MERRPICEGRDERFLVRLQFRLPAILAHHDTLRNGASVRHELGEVRTNPVACPVESINQSSCLLELNGEEVSCRDILPAAFDALIVRATLEYLIAPEVEPTFVRFTTEEVEIVLPDIVLGRVQRINEPAARQRRPEGCFRRLAYLAEAPRRGTEGIVRSRRRYGVEAVRLNIVKAIEAIRVSDELAVLRASESYHSAFYGHTVVIDDATCDYAVRGCRRER